MKAEREKSGLKLNNQKTKILASSPITSWQIDGETVTDFIFLGSKITTDGDHSHEINRHLLPGRKAMTNLDSILKSRHYFAHKGPSSQSHGFSSSYVWMWELDYKESWALKKWYFWTVVLEKTPESPLDCEEIQPVHPKEYQSWKFIGRTEAKAEAAILWPPDAKSWLIWKDPDAGKDRRPEEKGMAEDEMFGWHHQLNGHEFEQALGVGDGQGSLECCSPWGCKESDMTEWPNWLTDWCSVNLSSNFLLMGEAVFPSCSLAWGPTMIEVIVIMVTSFKRFFASTPCGSQDCCIQCPWPRGRPLSTHTSARDSWTLIDKSDSGSCGVTASFSWVLVRIRLFFVPSKSVSLVLWMFYNQIPLAFKFSGGSQFLRCILSLGDPLLALGLLQQCKNFFGIIGLPSVGCLLIGSIVAMPPRSAATRAPVLVAGHCWSMP